MIFVIKGDRKGNKRMFQNGAAFFVHNYLSPQVIFTNLATESNFHELITVGNHGTAKWSVREAEQPSPKVIMEFLIFCLHFVRSTSESWTS